MEGKFVSYGVDILTDDEIAYTKRKPWTVTNAVNPVHDNLVQEGGATFLEYINWLGLAYEPDMLTLSSRHHFFYDQNDIKGVKVLVNLKKMNTIKHLDSFLHILYRVLPPEANFIGCFKETKNHRSNGAHLLNTRVLYKKFIDFLDHKTDRIMAKSNVEELLESHGFKVVDMTEMNGMIYFNTLNQRNAGE